MTGGGGGGGGAGGSGAPFILDERLLGRAGKANPPGMLSVAAAACFRRASHFDRFLFCFRDRACLHVAQWGFMLSLVKFH